MKEIYENMKTKSLMVVWVLCLPGIALASDFANSSVTAETTVAVTSSLSFTHILTGGDGIKSGKIAENSVVASGTVALTGEGNISRVDLSWNRDINPEFFMAEMKGNVAGMKQDGESKAIGVQFVPVTQATYVDDGRNNAIYNLTAPSRMFLYTINTWKAPQFLNAGSYRLSVRANVVTA
ncbi:hypothetical protein RBC57_004596 [Salmonella enterica]|uniref:Fimbrial protein n=1 Tax=Salmonella enterica TaxID=28901 RepID=A0A628V826_SALER|nr:hypothetical protein [Salmonella enterica]EEC6702091.1 hypothetical protein [Salmonella enterica]ELF5202349.1 hypothetical protein [Salmonella enterica]